MLAKRVSGEARRTALSRQLAAVTNGDVSRRAFLRRSGLAAGGLAGLGALDLQLVRRADAKTLYQQGPVERKKTVCPFCAVGCSIWAEVKDGVWVG